MQLDKKSKCIFLLCVGGSGRKRTDGSGRKVALPELEEKLYAWFDGERLEKRRVTRKMFFMKATEMFITMQQRNEIEKDVKFGFSKGWLYRFMHRKNLTLRRKTTSCQKPPSDVLEKIANFVAYVRQIRRKHGYQLSSIIACDETAVWLDSLGNTTIDKRGAKEIGLRSTGHEKERITVMLSAKADGTKMKPFVLLDRKRAIKELDRFKSKLHLEYAGKSWMDEVLTIKYLKTIVGSNLFGGRRLLVWDSFRAHISSETKNELKRLSIDMAVIPGGCTKYIQAPDVCWNKPFKDKIRASYDDWLTNGEKSFTTGGNMRAAPLPIVCQWIIDAWDALDKKMIANSFKFCGISNNIDGSEDTEISCLKEGHECAGGFTILKERLAQMNESLPTLFEDVNLEVEDSDEDEEIILIG